MSFHASMEEGTMTLDDGHILKARLQNADGDYVDAELDLNTCIGNDDGTFQWGGVDFANSAENISLQLEGGDQVPVLRADLKKVDGESVPSDKNLAECIGNDNGVLVFTA